MGRLRLVLLGLALSGLLACSGGDRDYSDAVRDNFLDACELTAGQNEGACGCALEEIEEQFTEEEFLELERERNFTALKAAIDECGP